MKYPVKFKNAYESNVHDVYAYIYEWRIGAHLFSPIRTKFWHFLECFGDGDGDGADDGDGVCTHFVCTGLKM